MRPTRHPIAEGRGELARIKGYGSEGQRPDRSGSIEHIEVSGLDIGQLLGNVGRTLGDPFEMV
ncbi:hypothetical protein McPS_31080 [Marichromatium sp. PS1]